MGIKDFTNFGTLSEWRFFIDCTTAYTRLIVSIWPRIGQKWPTNLIAELMLISAKIFQLDTEYWIFYWTIFNNGSCQEYYLVSIENSYDRWVKLKLTSNDLILAQCEIKELEKYWLYIFIIRANKRRFFEDFRILFLTNTVFWKFSRTLPVFPRIYFQNFYFSIFKRSNFEFTNH